MLKEFRKKSFKIILPVAAALLAAAAVLLATGAYNIFYKFGGARDLYALENDQLENAYVEGEVYMIYDKISELHDAKGNVTYAEYFAPIGETEYMVIRVPAKLVARTDKLMEETVAFIEEWDEEKRPTSIYVSTGKVVMMDDELLEIYHNYVGYDNRSDESKALFLPYVWTLGTMGGVSYEYTYIGGLAAIALIIAAVWLLVKCLCFGYQKEIMRGRHKAAAQSVIQKTKMLRGALFITADLMIFQDGVKTRLVPASSVTGVSVGADVRGKYVLIECEKTKRRLHTADADYIASFIEKSYRLAKQENGEEKYKSILE